MKLSCLLLHIAPALLFVKSSNAAPAPSLVSRILGAIPSIDSAIAAIDNTLVPYCFHSSASRNCWGRYNINTDYYRTWPKTGVTRYYDLVVSAEIKGPDGYSKPMMLINGQYPGPTITADWGDTIKVTMTNRLPNNGSSFHFHGIRQYHTTEMDGANGVTECPLAPGQTKTYTFTATQYGTSWYHSHFSVQLSEGVLGAIVINGPTSSNYDADLGPVLISDIYHETAFSLFPAAQVHGPPPLSENGVINGMNVFNCTGSTDPNCTGTGKRWSTTVKKNRKYKLRLVNTSTDAMFKVMIDNHTMAVVQADFVAIQPFQADYLFLAIGQRYDVIIETDQPRGNYWLRAIAQRSCSSMSPAVLDNIRGIIRYAGQSRSNMRATPPLTPSTLVDSCEDVAISSLVPVVPVTPATLDSSSVGSSVKDLPISVGLDDGVFRWTLNGSSIIVDWQNPTIYQVLKQGTTSASGFPTSRNVIELTPVNQWVYFVVDSVIPVAHPIHLHGHDFSILAQGENQKFDPVNTPLIYKNTPRRDVALMPAGGFLVLAFLTDNPGAWLMHCHIAWHVAEGLSIQFLERAPEIKGWLAQDTQAYMTPTCNTWNAYQQQVNPQLNMTDSGL